jgi:hypothetical protein
MIFGGKSEGTVPLRGTKSRWEHDISMKLKARGKRRLDLDPFDSR